MPVGITQNRIASDDHAFYVRQVYVLCGTNDRVLGVALGSADYRTRSAAAYVCGVKNKTHLIHQVFDMITDDNVNIHQSGRLALILLSSKKLKGKGKYVDFGPPPNADLSERYAALELWQAWWEDHGVTNESTSKK